MFSVKNNSLRLFKILLIVGTLFGISLYVQTSERDRVRRVLYSTTKRGKSTTASQSAAQKGGAGRILSSGTRKSPYVTKKYPKGTSRVTTKSDRLRQQHALEKQKQRKAQQTEPTVEVMLHPIDEVPTKTMDETVKDILEPIAPVESGPVTVTLHKGDVAQDETAEDVVEAITPEEEVPKIIQLRKALEEQTDYRKTHKTTKKPNPFRHILTAATLEDINFIGDGIAPLLIIAIDAEDYMGVRDLLEFGANPKTVWLGQSALQHAQNKKKKIRRGYPTTDIDRIIQTLNIDQKEPQLPDRSFPELTKGVVADPMVNPSE